MKSKLLLIGLAGFLAGCQSSPVQVESAQGPVKCQLYMKEVVWWDHAVSHSDSLSKAEADQICRDEGHREQKAGSGSAASQDLL